MNELFTTEQKQELLQSLSQWAGEADHWAHFNQAWDVGFKILLLVVAALSAIGAATIAAKYKQSAPPTWLAIFNASASTLVAALSVFAFTQIDFASRERTYEIKRNEFGNVINEVKYFDPKKTEVFDKLGVIHSWSDTVPAPREGLPKKH